MSPPLGFTSIDCDDDDSPVVKSFFDEVASESGSPQSCKLFEAEQVLLIFRIPRGASPSCSRRMNMAGEWYDISVSRSPSPQRHPQSQSGSPTSHEDSNDSQESRNYDMLGIYPRLMSLNKKRRLGSLSYSDLIKWYEEEIQGLEEEIRGLEEEIQGLEEEIQGLEEDLAKDNSTTQDYRKKRDTLMKNEFAIDCQRATLKEYQGCLTRHRHRKRLIYLFSEKFLNDLLEQGISRTTLTKHFNKVQGISITAVTEDLSEKEKTGEVQPSLTESEEGLKFLLSQTEEYCCSKTSFAVGGSILVVADDLKSFDAILVSGDGARLKYLTRQFVDNEDEDARRFSLRTDLNKGEPDDLFITVFTSESNDLTRKHGRAMEAVLAGRMSEFRAKMCVQIKRNLGGNDLVESTRYYLMIDENSGRFLTICPRHIGEHLDDLGRDAVKQDIVQAIGIELGMNIAEFDTDISAWNYKVVGGKLMRFDFGSCLEEKLCHDELGSTYWWQLEKCENGESKWVRTNDKKFTLTDDISAQVGYYLTSVCDPGVTNIDKLNPEDKERFLRWLFGTLIIGLKIVKEEAGRKREPDKQGVSDANKIVVEMLKRIDEAANARANAVEKFIYSPHSVFNAFSKKNLNSGIGCFREAAIDAYHKLAVENKDPILTQAYLGWLIEQITAKVKAIPSKTCDAIALQKGGQGSTNGKAHFFQNGYLRTDHKLSTIAALNKIISGEVSDICGKIDKFFGGTPIPGDIKKYLVKIEQVIKGTSSCEVPEELRERIRP